MSRRLHHSVALFVALLLAVAGQEPMLVLCVGSDGHVSIEGPASDCCHDESEHEQRGIEVLGSSDCAGPCVDTPVTLAAAAKPSSSDDALDDVAVAIVPVLPGRERGAAPKLVSHALHDPPVLAPPSARRTVLLC